MNELFDNNPIVITLRFNYLLCDYSMEDNDYHFNVWPNILKAIFTLYWKSYIPISRKKYPSNAFQLGRTFETSQMGVNEIVVQSLRGFRVLILTRRMYDTEKKDTYPRSFSPIKQLVILSI